MIEKDQDNFSELRTATVTDVTMFDGQGTFTGSLHEIEEEIDIFYVTPYGSPGGAAMVAVPETQTNVLVCRPSGSKQWFYLGSYFGIPTQFAADEVGNTKKAGTVKDSNGNSVKDSKGNSINFGKKEPQTKAQKAQELIKQQNVEPASDDEPKSNFEKVFGNNTTVSNQSDKILLKGQNGHGLEISDSKNGTTVMDVKTELTSSNKKKITMHDSPDIDSIKLDSGNDATITLTQNPDRIGSNAGAIEIDSKGPQLHVSRESDLEMKVLGGGRELNIQNSANGVGWGKIAGIPFLNPIIPTGNVNIQSDRGDVNIMAKSPYTGRIFIETLNALGQRQLIKIGTAGVDGSIVLQANSIVLDATGAGGTIDLNAPAGVYINGGTGPVSTQGASIETEATGSGGVNIEPGSGVVNLANGAAAIPNSPRYFENTNPEDIYKVNDYFGRGLD